MLGELLPQLMPGQPQTSDDAHPAAAGGGEVEEPGAQPSAAAEPTTTTTTTTSSSSAAPAQVPSQVRAHSKPFSHPRALEAVGSHGC